MAESILRRLINHPQRRWIVITLSFVLGLAVTWPAVDDYTAAKNRRLEAVSSLEETQASAAQLEQFEKKVQAQLNTVNDLEDRVLTEERVQHFRNELVQMTRNHDCRIRRIRVGEVREREWYRDDNPLALRPVSDKLEKTPFLLRTRQFSVSVTGSLAGVTQMLSELGTKKLLMHASGLTMQKSDEDANNVILDLEMLFIELAKPEPKKPSA